MNPVIEISDDPVDGNLDGDGYDDNDNDVESAIECNKALARAIKRDVSSAKYGWVTA